jgi:hypothetical protein
MRLTFTTDGKISVSITAAFLSIVILKVSAKDFSESPNAKSGRVSSANILTAPSGRYRVVPLSRASFSAGLSKKTEAAGSATWTYNMV